MWYLGLDVGGSHIDCIAVSDEGQRSEYHHPRPIDTLPEELVPEVVANFMRDFSIKPAEVKELAIGWKLGRDDHRVTAMMNRFAKFKLSPKVYWHIESIHRAALPERLGILVFSGTNSIIYGVTSKGNVISSGGWSELLGDPGSAFSLGRLAIIAALKSREGRGQRTVLADKIPNALQMSLDDLLIMSESHVQNAIVKIASLGKLIFETAAEGDAEAVHVREVVCEALSNNIATVLSGWPKDDPMILSHAGNVLKWQSDFRYAVLANVKKQFPSAEWREPEFRAPYGALLCANPKLLDLLEKTNSIAEWHR